MMLFLKLIALCLFSDLFIYSSADFIVEKGSVSIIAPEKLRGSYNGSIANFGVPDYGATLTGTLVYDPKRSLGCENLTDAVHSPLHLPTVLLLDRGACYFALKVWHGQLAGAAAVLVADNLDEPLITMESWGGGVYIEKIRIPSALISKSLGDSIKKTLKQGYDVLIKLDWTDSLPHPDQRVEYELWTNSNDECGIRCDEQLNFIKSFKGHAQILEKGGYTRFTPHYVTWYCSKNYAPSRFCKTQCINHRRYCSPDPELDISKGYEGKDVVFENLRQLCVHRIANESGRAWVWWDYVTDLHQRCSMKEKKYKNECALDVIKSLGLPLDKVIKCMGDPDADVENVVLKNEQELQVGRGSRGDVAILPTLVINNAQYRGKLERTAVLRAICAGFKESTDPPICLGQDMETNECLERNGGCWKDTQSNVTACKDTFRGRLCQCPLIDGIQFHGDGYISCEAVGPGRCVINNGGCWSQKRNGQLFSACSESEMRGCHCPEGFHGDGHLCEDIDECSSQISCQCDGCHCKNTWGGYDCKCKDGLLYIKEEDTCIGRSSSRIAWILTFIIVTATVVSAFAGYIFYKYRFRNYMDAEIMAIMSQYMQLDNKQEADMLHEGSI